MADEEEEEDEGGEEEEEAAATAAVRGEGVRVGCLRGLVEKVEKGKKGRGDK